MVGAVVKIHFVADVQAQANRAQERLDATAWIKNSVQIVRTQVRYGAGKGSQRRRRIAEAKVVEATLRSDKKSNRAGSLQFRPKRSVQQTQVRSLDEERPTEWPESLREPLFEVICQLRFELEIRSGVHGEPCSNSAQICIGLMQAEIVCIYSELRVVG